ncbi:MAG: LacI family DNA-binding transcriptional regulator [Vibrio sp.]|uniref:LacI family DNA-binding transcriptional regulator n=1 Tax=Vibrio sp. TaxID=678 RepID=UPI003A8BB5EA
MLDTTSHKVTIKDIAKAMNISATSVSMALRGTGKLSDTTREEILATAQRMGYEKNHTAAKLRSKYSKVIGIIVGDISDSFTSKSLKGLVSQITNDDYLINIYQCDNQAEMLATQIRKLVSQNVDGIFLCLEEIPLPDSLLNIVPSHIPLVNLSKGNTGPKNLNYIGVDHVLEGKIAAEHLINLGHRRIAYVGGQAHSLCRADRVSGYCKVLKATNLALNLQWILASDNATIDRVIQDLIIENSSISALICHDAFTYNAALSAIEEVGRKIGTDQIVGKHISLLHFADKANDFPLKSHPLTVIADLEELGVQAWKRFIELNNQLRASCQRDSLSYELLLPARIE